jgi:NAD(P)-dependent dehydrogenase (short-subunit alcohol dehydrogenase family)
MASLKVSLGVSGLDISTKTYHDSTEIANAALFLASGEQFVLYYTKFCFMIPGLDESSYVNGQNLAVDGGLSASHPVVPGRWT